MATNYSLHLKLHKSQSFRDTGKRFALFERTAEFSFCVLIDCPADRGTAETDAAEEGKMVLPPLSPPPQKATAMLWCKISYSSGMVNSHNCRIWSSESPDPVREYEWESPTLNVCPRLPIWSVSPITS